jgi:DNA-binding IclR family transcriptional regulator
MVNGSADRPENSVRGTQSVHRALYLLRKVAQSSEGGVRLSSLVESTGLDRATIYRLLSCLVEEKFVDRDDRKLYRLGPEAVLLGSLLPQPTPLLSRLLPMIKRISRITRESVFLMMRQGDYVHCTHREEGDSLVQIMTMSIGQRRLLGTGTGGVAVLRLCELDEIKALYERHRKEYAERNLDLDDLLEMRATNKKLGCTYTYDANEVGVAAIGMAFRMGAQGIGAISLGTLTARFNEDRQYELRDLFFRELNAVGLLESKSSLGNQVENHYELPSTDKERGCSEPTRR